MKIVSLPNAGLEKPALHDVPLMLRRLADRVESGEFGDTKDPDLILRAIVVVRASRLEPIVLGFGADATPLQAFADLHAGAAELLAMGHPERT